MRLKRILPWAIPALLLASAAFAEDAPLTADTVQTNVNYVWTLASWPYTFSLFLRGNFSGR